MDRVNRCSYPRSYMPIKESEIMSKSYRTIRGEFKNVVEFYCDLVSGIGYEIACGLEDAVKKSGERLQNNKGTSARKSKKVMEKGRRFSPLYPGVVVDETGKDAAKVDIITEEADSECSLDRKYTEIMCRLEKQLGRKIKIIAIDFDGTLCESPYPKADCLNTELVEFTKWLQMNGYETILWTCRVGVPLVDAINKCKECGLEFTALNRSIPSSAGKYELESRKVYADLYIDDSNVRPDEIIRQSKGE